MSLILFYYLDMVTAWTVNWRQNLNIFPVKRKYFREYLLFVGEFGPMFEVLKVWTLTGGGLVVESLPGDSLKITFHFSPEIKLKIWSHPKII